jgi:hypothetical protein
MLKRQAGDPVKLPQPANGNYLEHQHCEIVRGAYETIHTSGLDEFIFSWVNSLYTDLDTVLQELDQLPEASFKELIEVMGHLSEARNELRLSRFLFDVEEINSVHRLIMRNRAVLRSKVILHKVIRVWPVQHPS